MGTVTERKSANGTTRYTAQIRLRRDGKVHTEAETWDSDKKARAWIEKREKELKAPGGLERAKTPRKTLAQVIDQYISESIKAIGKTKAQCLRTTKSFDIADMECSAIESSHIVAFAQELYDGGRIDTSTVGNYISHLSSIFELARPAWGYPLNYQAMKDAQVVLKKQLGIISKSKSRDRRPTLGELDLLMQHFVDRQKRTPHSLPMHRVTAFAIVSTRRQDEIARMKWLDFDEVHHRVLVRDMKNPGQKIGNDVWCELVPEAVEIIKAMPRVEDEIFPYKANTISDAFTDACKLLEIDDLRFHDLRHDGVSRLFEMGWTIAQAASVSGHRSWDSLKRYTQMRGKGDKLTGWKWWPVVTAPLQAKTA
ncbi:tyrosine-type recombinase/integrase [Mesorhizobium sp. M0488]|uniref:tyrosine-type recombinase/integrase n=1 Tax=unclassified Mesorhizobium TaxID=325217 RepID=UPI0033370DB5